MVSLGLAMQVRLMPAAVLLSAAMLVLVSLTGCSRAHAKVAIEPPRLDVPLPPPRVIDTVVADPPPLPPQLPAGATADIAPPTAPAAPAQAVTAKPESSRQPEPPRTEVSAPTEPAGPRLPASLQAVPAQQEVRLEAEIRKVMSTASNSLNRIDYRALSAHAQNQYDIAKNFILEAESQLKLKNLPFARSLADRAATLARELSSR
jgi:hypothetical protein